MSEEQVKKNHIFSAKFVLSEMPNSQKFINKISKVINQDEKLNIPRTLKFMEAALELTQDNLNHKEFVCRVLKTGTFKDLAKYLDKKDNLLENHQEVRVEPEKREKNWEDMSKEEKKLANQLYSLQVEFGHIPKSDEYVKEVKNILQKDVKPNESKVIKLMRTNIDFAKKDPKFSGAILKATFYNSYKDIMKSCIKFDKEQEKQNVISNKLLKTKLR